MQSYKNPKATWLDTPNFTVDRQGHDMSQPSWIVLHTMVGTVGSANSRFQQPAQQASATYGVGLDGTLWQWVDEKDAAWANGTFDVNPGSNLDSISIEHEDGGRYNDPRPDTLYTASAALVRDICTRYSIPIDRAHIIGHRECANASTACPDALDVERIVREAAQGGEEDLTQEEHDILVGVWQFLLRGFDDPAPGQTLPQHDSLLLGLPAGLDTIQKAIAKLGTTPVTVDATAVAEALATNATFLDAVAGRTVALLGHKASA